ncbi:Gag protease polyprotein [Cucumis melo var. makuwa]|uniref:Gag protease polyprotein n=1 Tax=Cucumis melo var. makuwa TaxID=1194695 RepID=A0A5D3C2T0_CUCMM|nr:Gag protease polyprotein [Cucumis melo var. makuwa]
MQLLRFELTTRERRARTRDRHVAGAWVKPVRQKPGGLFNPLPVPEWKWEHITMDFLFGLPYTSSGHNGIWVIVDRFTKTKAMGTRLKFSTSFHSQIDGRSEKTIQTLDDMLRACALQFKGSWDTHLPLMKFAYNNSYQSSIVWHHMRPYTADHAKLLDVGMKWESES